MKSRILKLLKNVEIFEKVKVLLEAAMLTVKRK